MHFRKLNNKDLRIIEESIEKKTLFVVRGFYRPVAGLC